MTRECMKKYLCIALGSSILSFGVYNFYYQSSITEGGVLGLLLILKNVFNFDVSISNIIIDGGMILVGLAYFGRSFFANTIFGSALFSITYHIFENIGFVFNISNPIIAAIGGGLCVGIGTGLIIKAGGAAGGDDVIALILSKFTKKSIGIIYLFTDLSVLLLSLSYLSVGKMLVSVVAVVISGQVINIMYNVNFGNVLSGQRENFKEEKAMGNHI